MGKGEGMCTRDLRCLLIKYLQVGDSCFVLALSHGLLPVFLFLEAPF